MSTHPERGEVLSGEGAPRQDPRGTVVSHHPNTLIPLSGEQTSRDSSTSHDETNWDQ